MSKMLNVEVQLVSKMPGSLIPVWAEGHVMQALAPGRLTPVRYRFSAAATNNADHASTKISSRPQIKPIRSVWGLFSSIPGRPLRCRKVLSCQVSHVVGGRASFTIR